MADNLLGVVGIIVSYLGIFITMLGVGLAIFYQGQALERPKEHARIGRRLRVVSYVWMTAAAVFFGLAIYLIVKL